MRGISASLNPATVLSAFLVVLSSSFVLSLSLPFASFVVSFTVSDIRSSSVGLSGSSTGVLNRNIPGS